MSKCHKAMSEKDGKRIVKEEKKRMGRIVRKLAQCRDRNNERKRKLELRPLNYVSE